MADHAVKQNNENDFLEMLLSTFKKYYRAMNDKDLEGVLSMIHSSSPAQMPTRQMLGPLMNKFKLIYEFMDLKYIGTDNDYIYIRINQKTTKLEGPDFRNNMTGTIVVMKQDENIWKIWGVMPLETNFL